MNYVPFNRNFFLSFSLLFLGLPSWAQDNVIEEVFVTAEKRSESLQDISQAVTAIVTRILNLKISNQW